MAKSDTKNIDLSTLTLREAATIYANDIAVGGKGLKNPGGFVSSTVRLFSDIADEPGSALDLFIPGEDGKTPISLVLEDLPEDQDNLKPTMLNLRLIGHNLLKKGLAETDSRYAFLPDSATKSDKNERIFGRLEPKKSESLIAINPDRDVQQEFFSRLAAKADDPAVRKEALAAVFLLNTGLRSEVIEQLEPHHYDAKKGALYIPGEVAGTKGNPVNIPLNPMADSIIQEFIQERKNNGLGADADGKNRIFFRLGKRNQPGKNIPKIVRMRTGNVTDVMRDIKIPKLTYDVKTDTFYDTLSPEGLDKQVKSGSRLLRNIHATLGEAIGIPDHRIAYLEGRSTKSIRKNISTGALEVYQVAFPFAISDLDRQHASAYSGFFAEAAEISGLDFDRVLNMQKPRVFADTPGYEGYFDKPVTAKPTVAAPLKEAAGDTIDLTPELERKLKEDGVFDKFMEKVKASGKTIKRTAGGLLTGTIVGNLLYNLAENPKETLGEIARDEAIEGAFRLLTKATTLPASVASMIIEPTAKQAGPEETMIDPPLQPPSEKNELTRYLESIGRSRMATAEESMLQPNIRYTEPDGKFTDPKLELMRRQSVIQKDVDDMSSIATEDAGFIQKNREPEAALNSQQGFITQ